MMNDKFDAQLRQHLLGSANERPAAGQLGAVIDAVATTRQRPPLFARLAWTPGRIGPVPTAAIRYALVAVALAMAMVAGALLAGGGGPRPTTVFEGTWSAIDPGDGSGMTLVIGAGPMPVIYFEDGYASGAACVADPVKRFTARGTGAIEGNRLLATYPDGGGCGLATVEMSGHFDYDAGTDTLSDQDGLVWKEPLAGPGPQEPTAPRPGSPEPVPTSQLGEARFDSEMHGISIDYPEAWLIETANQPWSGEPLTFDSQAADILFDPAHGEDLYVAIASQPYGGLTPDEWKLQMTDQICGDSGGSGGSWTVDGVSSWAFGCNDRDSVLIPAPERGYLIQVVVSAGETELVAQYNWDWLRPRLASVDLRPEDAVDGPVVPTTPPASVQDCRQFESPETYSANVGPLAVSVTVPATPIAPWRGERDTFSLGRATCDPDVGASPFLLADLVGEVYADACLWQSTSVEVSTPTAVAQLFAAQAAQTGLTATEPVETRLGSYSATRLDVSVPAGFDRSGCDDRLLKLYGDRLIVTGITMQVYVVDVDGETLVITANYDPNEVGPADLADIDSILATLQVEG